MVKGGLKPLREPFSDLSYHSSSLQPVDGSKTIVVILGHLDAGLVGLHRVAVVDIAATTVPILI